MKEEEDEEQMYADEEVESEEAITSLLNERVCSC